VQKALVGRVLFVVHGPINEITVDLSDSIFQSNIAYLW